MKSFRVLLSGLSILLFPSLVLADNATLKVCNKASVDIYAAVAARVQLFITGYRWETEGWYKVASGECSVVYSRAYEPAGLITPQSGARIAFTTVNPVGFWGAWQSPENHDNGGWLKHTTASLCVKRGVAFSFTEPAGDPAAGCDDMIIPAEEDFLPECGCNYTATMAWNGTEVFFKPLGVESGATARLIYGDEVRFDGTMWNWANGTALPKALINYKNNMPPLLPKWQNAASRDPAARYIKQIKDVMNAVYCTDPGNLNRTILAATFTMDDFGVVIFTRAETNSLFPQTRTLSDGAAIANLDLDKAEVTDAPCVILYLTCKDGACIRTYDEHAGSWMSFYVNTRAQAEVVLSALRQLATYYPLRFGEIH